MLFSLVKVDWKDQVTKNTLKFRWKKRAKKVAHVTINRPTQLDLTRLDFNSRTDFAHDTGSLEEDRRRDAQKPHVQTQYEQTHNEQHVYI